mmetsp:Transcript_37592/g.91212  ORF Transcript_37592/g.91212 Transcript_37592/m.91212 type:complete len:450 (-) Transcript_37592:162-1511(-)
MATTMSLSNAVSQKISSFRNRLPTMSSTKSYECEECPVCWSNMPSNPKVLPCGHKFCRKCIRDLKTYQEERDADACCPMCRGPVKKVSAKRLWAEAKMHESEGYDYYRMQRVEVSVTAANRMVIEAQREYRMAVKKLEECLEVLKMDHQNMANNTRRIAGFTSPSRRDSKHRRQQIRVLCKLIEVVPMARYEDSDERTIRLLRTTLAQAPAPMPHLNLKLAKLLHRQFDEDLMEEVMDEYERILQIASENSGMASRHAKKLRGQAHYGLARCYHQMEHYRKACLQYSACERFHALQDHGLAAECHFFVGNYVQAMDYASMQLRKESTRPTIDTLLLMARICKAYFMSIRSYRGIDALDYQSRCETYRRCVRHAQLLARHEDQHEECNKHAQLLNHLLYPTQKKRTITPSYVVTPSSSDKDDDSSSGCDDDDNEDLETEEYEDSEASVEL